MQKLLLYLSFLLIFTQSLSAQTVNGRLRFEPGKIYKINMEVKNTMAQQAMGQAIDFSVNGKAWHVYRVTNAAEESTTLRHEVNKISFEFDGMGQKTTFDSDNQKDMEGQFGKPVRELLMKKYDMVVDTTGTAMMCKPEKFEKGKTDDRTKFITDMLRDLTVIAYPPARNTASFFRILPAKETAIGESWSEEVNEENEKSITNYTLSSITDSVIIVDFKTTANTVIKSEIMGVEAITNMNSKSTGKVTIDRTTGIIREKTSVIESSGTTEAMGSTMPVTAKTNVRILVASAD